MLWLPLLHSVYGWYQSKIPLQITDNMMMNNDVLGLTNGTHLPIDNNIFKFGKDIGQAGDLIDIIVTKKNLYIMYIGEKAKFKIINTHDVDGPFRLVLTCWMHTQFMFLWSEREKFFFLFFLFFWFFWFFCFFVILLLASSSAV